MVGAYRASTCNASLLVRPMNILCSTGPAGMPCTPCTCCILAPFLDIFGCARQYEQALFPDIFGCARQLEQALLHSLARKLHSLARKLPSFARHFRARHFNQCIRPTQGVALGYVQHLGLQPAPTICPCGASKRSARQAYEIRPVVTVVGITIATLPTQCCLMLFLLSSITILAHGRRFQNALSC